MGYETNKNVKREIRNELARRLRALPLYKKAVLGCSYGPQDIQCDIDDYSDDYYSNSDNLDLTSHARDNVANPKSSDENEENEGQEDDGNVDPRTAIDTK